MVEIRGEETVYVKFRTMCEEEIAKITFKRLKTAYEH